ncbi:putative polysaccharide biosynthesis protein [Enterococcus italicus]|uniref:Polysaccharide biosynthesis protein n=1 Tax=Enterococcus italicus (strain DSM 15952 / CCUG 50447 / LMG 22039 / TP 1.5) TaxID=888064 RepID=E6LEY4_ENTI1|nr:polysaccharide biosynthesis protein [Enterococcus italicus]EFU74244.1 polysaccharide biosynthesis protein [Enterococcus italicus DSM 15952]OJG59958.1 polysaccharide biosynthesis protein [Enterococcus italicus DSM 15952]
MANKSMHSLVRGAFILTLASFFAKLLSAIYRVPFQNLVGDRGFYVYQQIYPIYGIAMTIALTSVPQFLSKLLVGQSPLEKRTQLRTYFSFIFGLSVLAWLFLLLTSDWLALGMGDKQLAPLIRVTSFTFLLIPFLSFYRGSFQGDFYMVPTAVSQIIEQVVRVGIILLAALGYVTLHYSIYRVGAYALSGSLFGGVVAWMVLVHYSKQMSGNTLSFWRFLQIKPPSRAVRMRFYREAGMLTVFSSLLILFQLMDSFFVVNGLIIAGMPKDLAQLAKGVYDRGQPLVQLGLVVAGALGTSFLPALTEHLRSHKLVKFRFSAIMYLRLTVSLSLAASIGLAMLMPFVNYTLFKDFQGTKTLLLFVFAIALMAIIQAFQSIEQSRNKVLASFKAVVCGCIVKFVTTGILTAGMGTIGASLSTLLGLAAVLATFLHFDELQLHQFWTQRKFGWRLLGALAGMVVMLSGYDALCVALLATQWHRSLTLVVSLGGVVLGAAVFLLLIIKLKVFTVREWLFIPFGEKLLRIGEKK